MKYSFYWDLLSHAQETNLEVSAATERNKGFFVFYFMPVLLLNNRQKDIMQQNTHCASTKVFQYPNHRLLVMTQCISYKYLW